MAIRQPHAGVNHQILHYHQITKHDFHAYAPGPGYLDWATQPDPFRRYRGAPLINLEQVPPGEDPTYESALRLGQVPIAPLNYHSLSQLFFDGLAISAWKQAGSISWALRVNPSSGNLHPTEGYLVCGPIEGLCETPMVCHYAPREHTLERRAEFPISTWRSLAAELPPEGILIGLTSIHWREAWKYGQRAFRYCQHDVGHAIAAISVAAAGLGWQATLLDDVGTGQLANLLGVFDPARAEPEHPDCLLAVYPQHETCATQGLPEDILAAFVELGWHGRPNLLSPSQVDWGMGAIAEATIKPATDKVYTSEFLPEPMPSSPPGFPPISLRQITRQRRSAVDMDGRTWISRETFYHILRQTLPGPDRFPFNTFPWSPRVHLALFVHRVHDLQPGLYLLLRVPAQQESLQAALRDEFAWEKPEGCPPDLGLYRLASGDLRAIARQVSCHQDIASDGVFSLGMLADFKRSIDHFGPWFYSRLFWECGAIGQALYLAAEAAGVRGTGIGCFFDDPMHHVLGLDLESFHYQSLYHFTIGGPVEDLRLTTLPAYPDS